MKIQLSFYFLAISFALFSQSTTFVGHRGVAYRAPENTLASFELAWELGVEAAECDIMLTKDNRVIVFHDKKGKRLTGNNFIVKNSNYNDIAELPISLSPTNSKEYEGETIPLLEEVLATIPDGRILVIEIKTGPEILPYMQKVIEQHWKSGNIAFIAFDFQTILETKKLYPDVPCYYLSSFRSDVEKKIKTIANSDLDGVDLRYKIIDEKLVSALFAINKDIWCWTVNAPEEALRLQNLGVSAITTDRPAWLKKAVSNL